jgi:RHS repeat-associated protein
VTASFVYGAWGEVVPSKVKGEGDHRRQFNGKEADAVSGLRYYGFRYYDPLVMRWSSADPLFLVAPDAGLASPRRNGLYTFSLNNANQYYDPDGRNADDKDEGKKSA